MKVCFDANVLLEVLLTGRKQAHAASTAISRVEDAVISPLTVHLYVYFGKKENCAVAELLNDLKNYSVAAMDNRTVAWAIKHCQDNDFEDALQVGCAMLEDCGQFVTFDKKLAENYKHFINIELLG